MCEIGIDIVVDVEVECGVVIFVVVDYDFVSVWEDFGIVVGGGEG